MTSGNPRDDTRPRPPSTRRQGGVGGFGAPSGPSAAPFGPVGAALAATALWLALVLAVLFLPREDPGDGGAARALTVMLAVVVPLGLIWIAAALAVAVEALRRDLSALAAPESGRPGPSAPLPGAAPDTALRLDRIAAAQARTEAALAALIAARPAGAIAAPRAAREAQGERGSEGQAALALGTPPEAPPLPLADVISALQFPADENDREGFQALHRAMKDPKIAPLVTAAQDILTLLSQDGIYMDDQRPIRAGADVWRDFAHGARGRAIASLGGIRDRALLSPVTARMRADTIFRDTAHHFLRLFDRTLAQLEPAADDEQIAALADTRTARAFMLLGRAAGTFD